MRTGTPVTGGSALALLPALERLDALLLAAADRAPGVLGKDVVDQVRSRPPTEPLFPPDGDEPAGRSTGPAWLGAAFGLSALDLDVVLLAVAPELDLRYERLYRYLQDDPRRGRPTVDLALNLFCADASERIAARSRFAVDAPLVRHHLVSVVGGPGEALLNRSLLPDEQVLRLLVGESALDSRLAGCAELTDPAEAAGPDDVIVLAPATRDALAAATTPAPRLQLLGPADSGQAEVAAALAADRGLSLLTVDLRLVDAGQAPLAEVVRVAFREAWFRGAALMLVLPEWLPAEAGLAREVAASRVPVLLAGEHAGPPAGAAVVPFPALPVPGRRAIWERQLAVAGLDVPDAVVTRLAGQYRLGPERIAAAVTEVARTGPDEPGQALAAAARRQSGYHLNRLARRVDPAFGWDDLVLPAAARRLLRELTDRVLHRQRVLSDWRFDEVLASGRGTCALFAGPSGTGKSMAAAVIAAELGLDLYEINLATVVSKYIGETEQNLERVFAAAERGDAVLFFDEADALFGKRSDVTDAHDRYANLEIAYLLRRMEQYEGVAILATNLRDHLDDAFLRRLHFVVDFPMPDREDRERMWRRFVPSGAPVADTVDYAFLANRFGLSGGNIKNIVVSAAFLASANGGLLGMPHLIRATWVEHRKIGRVLTSGDAGEYASLVPADDREPVR